MTVEAAIEKMTAIADGGAQQLNEHGVSTSVTCDMMNGVLRIVESAKKAKFVTVSIVITADGIPEGEEYCLSLGANVKRGEVDEAQLDKDAEKFAEMIDDTITRLDGTETKADAIRELTAEAEIECKKILAEIEEKNKKSRRITNLITVATVVVMFILYFLLIYGAGNGT